MTYREVVLWGESLLEGANVTEAKLDSWLLLQMATKMDRSYYYTHMEDEIPAEQLGEYELAIRKRAERVPLQYITGEQDFMGLTFKVNSNVLIPRQDTETLVEEALKVIQPGMKVLDLCTGSGCIMISIMKNVSDITGTASDASKQALLVAKENGKQHELDIEWIRSNLFDNLTEKYHVIVSNPPYIPSGEIVTLMPEVQDFEPVTALDGGVDGLDFYRKIAEQSKEHLVEGGYLYLEIGYDQGKTVPEILEKNGFTQICVIKDLAGNDRVVRAQL